MLVDRRRTVVWLTASALLCLAAGGGVALLRDERGGSTWDFYRVEGNAVEVFKTVRPCDDVVSAQVDETADRVEIVLHVDSGGTCGDIAVDKSAAVTLRQPLGLRPVYDAACLDVGRSDRDCLRASGPSS
jgi:hypothetical protein